MAEAKQAVLAGRKLFIAIPAYDGKINIKRAYNIAALMPKALQFGVSVNMGDVSGCSIITMARNQLVHEFLKSDCTELLFIDSDVIATPDDILRLMAQSGDKDITAGMYPRRSKDRNFFADLYFNKDKDFEFEGSLMRLERVGTGFMLIQRHVLETMVAAHPEWAYDFKGEQVCSVFDFKIKDGHYLGEDYLFCDRAREHGFKIYADVDISLPHVGTETYENNFREEVVIPLLEMVRQSKLKVVNG